MEKTVKFAVFKEKIIKTNELLNLLLERNKSLEKSQKWNQHLKSRLDLSKSEVNKLKFKNETLTFNFTTIEKNYSVLREDHDNLKEQFNRLEVDSHQTINRLQVNYQTASQKLSECQKKLSLLQPNEGEASEDETTVRKSSKKKQPPVTRGRKSSGEFLTKKLEHLQAEKEKLVTEKCDLQLEVYELKKQVETLKCYHDDFEKDKNEVTALKETLKSKSKEIEKLSKEIKTVETAKVTLQEANEALRIENVLSQQANSAKEAKQDSAIKQELITVKKNFAATIEKLNEEITKLSGKIESLNVENDRLRNENCSYRDELLKLKDVVQKNNPCIVEKPTRDLLVEEAVPKRQKKFSETPTDEEISSIMQSLYVPSRVSPLSTEGDGENPPDLKSIVNRRRYLTRRKKQLLARRKKQHVDIYGTLLALKKANIHFLISDNSLLPSSRGSSRFPQTYFPKIVKYKQIEKEPPMKLLKELECSCCCKTSYMLLQEGEKGDSHLLGFKDIKDENSKPQKEVDHDLVAISSAKRRKVCEIGNSDNRTNPSCSEPAEEENRAKNVESECQNKDVNYNTKSVCGVSLQTRKKRKNSRLSVIKKRTVKARSNLQLRKFVDICEDEETLTCCEDTVAANNLTKGEEVFKKLDTKPKSPKRSFKRPVCSTRRSPRLKEQLQSNGDQEENREIVPLESPSSPTPECQARIQSAPVLIPLEKRNEEIRDPEVEAKKVVGAKKMPTTKIQSLFHKLVIYSAEEEALKEVVREFSSQEPGYIAEAILERVALDIHDKADAKHRNAPLMTDVQRTMLGFMSKLEKSNVTGVFDRFLTLAERRLLTSNDFLEFNPITRLYLAVCKLEKNLTRMRKLCCDVFYFCGDLAIPFFFTVLTSWTQVLPHAADAKDFAIARVLVQIVYTSECTKPGYNLMPLRDLLVKFYGYPTERRDYTEFFKELLEGYLRKPSSSSGFALLLYCKNRPEKWVYETVEEHLKPLVSMNIQDNFKATLIILIGNLYNRFSSKSEVSYLPAIRKWLLGLVTGKTPEVVRRCVYVSLKRLKKK